MARIRTIKPEFWTDPDVVACSMAARLFFIGCWNHADDYGVLKDEPERIRLQVMPADNVDADAIVDELVERALLLRMVTPDGTAVLVVRTFLVHQKIDKRSVGRYGDPETFRPAQSPPIPPSPHPVMEGKGLEGRGEEHLPSADADGGPDATPLAVVPLASSPPAVRARKATDAEFQRFWDAYPRRIARTAARKAFDKAVAAGVDPDHITAAAAAYDKLPGRETRFTKHPTTWLNQGCWDDELIPLEGTTATDRTRRNLVDGLRKDQPLTFKERMEAISASGSAVETHAIGSGG